MYQLIDFVTRAPVTSNNLVFTGDVNPWEVVMDLERIRKQVNIEYFKKAPPFVSKYLPFMPVKDYASFVSLGEGATPLIRSSNLGQALGIELYFKLESQNPTGSFKDRGSAVEISVARELNVKGITVASTGNMAASCSCYAANAHIPCFVFVPEGTPPSKLAQVISYGGRIVQVKGGYGEAAALAKRVAEELGFYLAGDYAFRVEGHKTAAFEMIDQMFFQVPDIVVVPMGCGTNMASYAKGFEEYRALGFIDRVPRLVGVQAAGANPIIQSFDRGERTITPIPRADSIASAICINNPIDGVKALDAMYSTGGTAIATTDPEMLGAQYRLSKEEGLFVETSCAATIAALSHLAAREDIGGKKVVCILTGSGLKDPSPILNIAIKPPTIYPDVQEFLSLYEGAFFEGKSIALVDRESVIFSSKPTLAEVESTLQHHFSVSYAPEYVERIRAIIERFLIKGKPVTFSDLQDIVQDALESVKNVPREAFRVLDFEVTTGRDRKAKAQVEVEVSGERVRSNAEGVGPVDAVILALRSACGQKIQCDLSGYKVGIRSQGTDAVVYVEMKLLRGSEVSAGTGTSPDIIQASIEAFEGAYNGFQRLD